jgi:hypothetical protein
MVRVESGAVCGALGCRESPEWRVSHPDYGRRVLCPRHAEGLLNQPSEQSPAKARERSEQERGGGWGATSGSELEGGSEGTGRPPTGGRDSPCSAVAVEREGAQR